MAQTPLPQSLLSLIPTSLPSPLKAIAGIAVTAVEDTRHLPQRVGELPATVLTTLAAQSMKMQQQYAEWVAKGEQFISSLREPQADAPDWATFDEDLPAPAAVRAVRPRAAGVGPGSSFDLQDDEVDFADAELGEGDAGDEPTKAATKKAPVKKAPAKQAPVKKTPVKKAPVKKAPVKRATANPATQSPSTTVASPQAAAPRIAAGDKPQSLPEFDSLSIPQLRSRLKTLKSAELVELIEHEERSANRNAVIQMLRARLETLQK